MHDRRVFLAESGAVAALALLPSLTWAQAKPPQNGVEFLTLEQPVPVDTASGKIELLEFFWYSCPHCNAFEPVLADWVQKLPKDVAFKRIPIAFNDSFVPQQRLYYALEAMGMLGKLHSRVFAAIHTDKKNLSRVDTIVDWAVQQGLNKAKFVENFNSFTTTTQVNRATQLQAAYRVEGVPSMGIAGRFYTDGAFAKSMEGVLRTVEFLLSEVRQRR